jgi:hypothetical protein
MRRQVSLHAACLVCRYCKDKKKFGGPARLKKLCIQRRASKSTESTPGDDGLEATAAGAQAAADKIGASIRGLRSKALAPPPLLSAHDEYRRRATAGHVSCAEDARGALDGDAGRGGGVEGTGRLRTGGAGGDGGTNKARAEEGMEAGDKDLTQEVRDRELFAVQALGELSRTAVSNEAVLCSRTRGATAAATGAAGQGRSEAVTDAGAGADGVTGTHSDGAVHGVAQEGQELSVCRGSGRRKGTTSSDDEEENTTGGADVGDAGQVRLEPLRAYAASEYMMSLRGSLAPPPTAGADRSQGRAEPRNAQVPAPRVSGLRGRMLPPPPIAVKDRS